MAKRQVGLFLSHFVAPLVRGGEMFVEAPLSEQDLESFVEELPHATEALVEVDEARTNVLAALVVRPPALVLDEDELHLAASVHNLLFLVHPRAEGAVVSAKARRRVIDTAQKFAARPMTTNRTRSLARHGLLHNLFEVSRADTKLSWWTGSAEFQGQQPPARLMRWSGLRRVRQQKTEVGFEELFASIEAAPVIATLLRRSPLTHLFCARQSAPSLHWEDALFLLHDPEIARAICYEALGSVEGEGRSADPLPLPSRYAAAFEQLLERNPGANTVTTVATFLVYLSALLCYEELDLREMNGASPFLESILAPDRAAQRPRGLAAFFSLPEALGLAAPELSQPPGLAEDPALAARWGAHRKQVREALGEALISSLSARIARRLDRAAVVEPAPNPG